MDTTLNHEPQPTADSAAETPSWRRWFPREILLPWLLSRLALVLVGLLAMFLLHHTPVEGAWEIGANRNRAPAVGRISSHYPLVNMWSRWDASWYEDIAEFGYHFSSEKQSNAAFFPLYPLLMRATHVVVQSHKTIWWFVCGMVVSNVALLGCLSYFFLLARMEFNEATARRAVLYLLIFPTTLFLSAVYAEAVFLCFIIGSFYHARRGQWWRAGLLGMLAAVSRPPGIMICAGLLVEYLLQCNFSWRKVRWNVLALGLPPLALGSFFAYLRYSQGSAAAAVQAQGTWGLGLQNPLRTMAPFFRPGSIIPPIQGTYVDLGFTLVFIGLVIAVAWRFRESYGAHSVAMLIFITMWRSLESMPRYVLGLFPVILLLAVFGRNEAFHRAYVPFSAGLAGLFMAVFAVWGWVA